MKKNLLAAVLSFASLCVFAQKETDSSLVELSKEPCDCIGAIKTTNKTPKQVAQEISECIDKAVGPYQTITLLTGALKDSGTVDANGKKTVSVQMSYDKNSPIYKKYYYVIERYLMENCAAMKSTVAQQNLLSDRSLSDDELARNYYNKGQQAAAKEDYEQAVKMYKKAVDRDSVFAFAWDNLGLSLRKLGKYDEALAAYQKSLEIDPNGVMPLQNMAIVYSYKKQFDEAIKVYERMVQKDSTNPESFYGIGQIAAMQLHDYEKGLDNMCKAYSLYAALKSPYRTDAEQIIQVIYAEMKKQGKEEKFFEILKNNHLNPGKGN